MLNIYEGLVFFNRERTDEFIPALATDWTSNEDGTQWVFNIRQGVKFHKGGTLEPHDIAYSTVRSMLQGRVDGPQSVAYEPFFGPALAVSSIRDFAAGYIGKETFEDLSEADLIKVCEDMKLKIVADDAAGTVTYNLNQPTPWLFSILSQQFLGGILDQEWMVEIGDWNGDCATWTDFADPSAEETTLFNQANGTGPYMLDHWTPGEETVLVANPDYWRTEPMWEGGPSGVAKIPRILIKNIVEWGTRLAMFEAGDADRDPSRHARLRQLLAGVARGNGDLCREGGHDRPNAVEHAEEAPEGETTARHQQHESQQVRHAFGDHDRSGPGHGDPERLTKEIGLEQLSDLARSDVEAVKKANNSDNLLEIVMDLGRQPVARFVDRLPFGLLVRKGKPYTFYFLPPCIFLTTSKATHFITREVVVPTSTLAAIARGAGLELKLHEQARQMVKERYDEFAARGILAQGGLNAPREKMAWLPEGAVPLDNPVGTAPAVLLRTGQSAIICLPGVPSE
ncbi:MAG: hypothetical protein HGA82_03290, partial [Anaerolineales bacterium]|nr:hypothetical protein [Anaerolineales bacterium]